MNRPDAKTIALHKHLAALEALNVAKDAALAAIAAVYKERLAALEGELADAEQGWRDALRDGQKWLDELRTTRATCAELAVALDRWATMSDENGFWVPEFASDTLAHYREGTAGKRHEAAMKACRVYEDRRYSKELDLDCEWEREFLSLIAVALKGETE